MIQIVIIGASFVVAGMFLVFVAVFPKRKESQPRLGKNERKLGDQEAYYVYENESNNLVVSNLVILESKKNLTKPLVLCALIDVARKHPILRMNIEEERQTTNGNRNFFFKENSPDEIVDFREVDAVDWWPVMNDEFKTKFDVNRGPLWRVRLLKPKQPGKDGVIHYEFIFSFLHAIIDGTAIMQIYKDFLEYLENRLKGREPIVQSLEMVPSLEEHFAAEIKPTFADIAKFKMASLWSKFSNKKFDGTEIGKLLYDTFSIKSEEHCSVVLPISFNEEETSFIIRKSKGSGIHIHALTVTSACVALRRLLDMRNVKSGPTMNVQTNYATAFRRLDKTGTLLGGLGCYVNVVNPLALKLPATMAEIDRDFWTIAAEYQKGVTASATEANMIKNRKQTNLANVFAEESIRRNHAPRDDWLRPFDSFFINWGAVSVVPPKDETREIKLLNVFCGTGTMYHDYFCNLTHSIVTADGRMSWTFQYRSNLMSKEVATEYAALIKQELLERCK